jgi:hypothetical protein
MHDVGWIRWYMVGFFVLFGLWLLGKRESFANVSGAFCSLGLDGPARVRLGSAVRERQTREALPSSAMAVTIGGVSLVMAVVAALTTASVTLLYAMLTFVLGAVLSIAYVRFRRSESRRVASLRARRTRDVVAWYIWPIVSLAAVSPVFWFHGAPLASPIIVCAGLTIEVLAYRVATMPALLLGDDVLVERFVDDRLRAIRTTNLLAVAVAPGYVFEAFNGFTDSNVHLMALLFSLVAIAITTRLQFVSLRHRPSPSQVAEWAYVAI